MKQMVMKAILNMCAKVIFITTVVGVGIGILGYFQKWSSSIAYSDAFFLAGCLVIVAGTASRLAGGQGWNSLQLLNAESFRGMSSSEQANYIVEVSSSYSAVILGLLSGILLILISAIAAKIP